MDEGIGSSKLNPYIGDVGAWLQASISPLVSLMVSNKQMGAVSGSDGDDQYAHIMLRRLLWLLCCWSYLIPPAMLPDICKLLHAILDMSLKGKNTEEPDVVVMFQVVATIQAITNVESFTSDMIVNEFSALVENLCGFTLLLGDSDHRAQVVDLIGMCNCMSLFVFSTLTPYTLTLFSYFRRIDHVDWSGYSTHNGTYLYVLVSIVGRHRST